MSEAPQIPRPAPAANPVTQFHWDAAREHRLVIQRCDACGHYVHWPQLICPRCQSESLSPAEVSGRGTVYSFTIVHHVFHPGFASPYNLAIVELDEQPGLRMLTNVLDCPNDELRVGMPVEVTFEDCDGYALPQFRPRSKA